MKPGGIDELALPAVKIQFGDKIIAGRARQIGNQSMFFTRQGVKQAAFAGVWLAQKHRPDRCLHRAARFHLIGQSGDTFHCLHRVELQYLLRRNKRQILVGKIESGFQMGEQFQKHVAQLVQRAGQSAGQLCDRDL